MPGLLGGLARTAVAAGTWTAVSNRVSHRQAERWAQQDQQRYYQQPASVPASAPAAPAAAAAADPIARLKGLAELKEKGILTDAEFTAGKAKILA